MEQTLRILIVEDSCDDVYLMERALQRAGLRFTSLVIRRKCDFEDGLKDFHPDVILSDHFLPQFNSIEAFSAYREYRQASHITIPFILVTGCESAGFGDHCLKAGMDACVLKDNLSCLPAAIHMALEKSSVTEDRRAGM